MLKKINEHLLLYYVVLDSFVLLGAILIMVYSGYSFKEILMSPFTIFMLVFLLGNFPLFYCIKRFKK
ncbi:hypothetical protein CBF34_05125 [Vagococcus penaei]|uniref:Uncharacterized protein n=1 Tax=Vagococcus penaei TaxID=633807 RepID=A0A1Q2D6N2_9ENTE|nr:hypothetical protein BW732_06660 [Vagococcus penaei]RSU02904.1 hypothetical protein CBF34_05125 [Vagococcus penaei]